MCEFCTQHGEGKKWYLQMKNYSDELLHQELSAAQKAVAGVPSRYIWNDQFLTSFVFPAGGIHVKREKTNKEKSTPEASAQLTKKEIEKEIPDPDKAVHYGQVLPMEDAEKVFDMASSITRMPCGCRYKNTGKEDCRYCFGIGMERLGMFGAIPDGSTSLEVLDKEQAKGFLRKFDKEGLFHSVWTGVTPYIIGVCNCDHDCGAYRTRLSSTRTQNFFRGEYICQADWDLCNGCKACMRQCQFGAMFYSSANKKVIIDPARCFGCGVCRSACTKKAITLLPRESHPQAAGIWSK